MNSRLASVLAGALAITGTLVVVLSDTKTLDTQKEVSLQPERLARLPDGGKTYIVEVQTDAGVEVRTTTPKCSFRKPGGRCTRADGGDQGDWNRLPGLVGVDCIPAACAVLLGEDSMRDEDDVVKEVALDKQVLE